MASGLQVHGGIGFTWEHDFHLYIKRSQFAGLSYGDAAFHRDRVAESTPLPASSSGAGVFRERLSRRTAPGVRRRRTCGAG